MGESISIKEIESTIIKILQEIDCNCLALSGGIDSSLLLYFLSRIHPKVHVFTIGDDVSHPDVVYSKLVAKQFANVDHKIYIPTREETQSVKDKEFSGDDAVKLFYRFVRKYTDRIIAGDGIDEFMAGYYRHQRDPSERMYFSFVRALQKEQLRPLDRNSGKIKVCLPYIDERLLTLLHQIPLSDKVDSDCRKKVMVRMAEGKLPESVIVRRKYGFCSSIR